MKTNVNNNTFENFENGNAARSYNIEYHNCCKEEEQFLDDHIVETTDMVNSNALNSLKEENAYLRGRVNMLEGMLKRERKRNLTTREKFKLTAVYLLAVLVGAPLCAALMDFFLVMAACLT